jgi:hypothetical protein
MTDEHPYRAVTLPEPRPDAPREIVYFSRDQERHVAPGRLFLQAILVSGVIAVGLSAVDHQAIGLAAMGAAMAWAIWRWHRARDIGGVLLRVREGELTVSPRNGARSLLDVPLRDLLDVRLETKSIHKVMRDTSIAAVNVGTHVGPEVDVTRIVLVPREPVEPLSLTEAFVPHLEAAEAFAKIRTFLRAHGWVPVDERRTTA